MRRFSPIAVRLFGTLIASLICLFVAIYWFTVPFIKNDVFKLELNSNRQVLNVVYDLARQIHLNVETYSQRSLANHEQRLQSIVELAENYMHARIDRAEGAAAEDVRRAVFKDLRDFKFGEDGYVWVADYSTTILSHPADDYNGRDMLNFVSEDGDRVIKRLVDAARRDGAGFYSYKWPRLDGEEIIEKYSYVKDFPQWGLVIGSGVYIDTVKRDVDALKEQAIKDLAEAMRHIKIAWNGYLYVFDASGFMLHHPNANIHGKDFREQRNPVTGHPIYQDLMAVADTDEELYYQWDRPDDPGNYDYEKLSLVRHLPGFDWYIASSVYLDDLKFSADQMGQRIMLVGLTGLLAGIFGAVLFARWLTSPIRQLSNTAQRISGGDFSAETGIKRNDELGTLASAFDYMVGLLRDNIATLNRRVAERTEELTTSNQQLREAVSSLEKTQIDLRSMEQRQRLILNALPAQVAYFDDSERFVFANRDYALAFGYDSRSIVGQTLREVVGADMYADTRSYLERARAGERVIYEYALQTEQGRILTRRTVLPFYEDGRVAGLLTLSIDITDERDTERRLAEASKMKTVGQMSGGMAHDFNNLLTIILGNLLELRELDDLPPNGQEHLAPAIRATRRAADITKRLLAFSRRQPLSPSRIDPAILLHDLATLLAAPMPGNVELMIELADEAPCVFVDAARMEDALVNLALNSSDAMPDGGRLLISANVLDIGAGDDNRAVYDEVVAVGRYLQLKICDDGTGFSAEAMEKALEPFFTTKSASAGTGLGLSMVYGFVKQSAGYLRLFNQVSGGACVELLLPTCRDDQVLAMAADDTLEKVDSALPGAGGLVVLVEDNDDLRELVRRQLVEMDYKVLECSNAAEAMSLLEVELNDLVGVVSDVMMPGEGDGYDVVDAAQRIYPSSFVLLMTAYSERLSERANTVSVLQKPFTKQQLQGALCALAAKQKHNNENA